MPQSAPFALSLETSCLYWRLPCDQATENCAFGVGGVGKEPERKRGGKNRGMRDADGWGEEGCTRLNAPLASRSLLSEHTQDTALGSLAVAAMVLCPFSK